MIVLNETEYLTVDEAAEHKKVSRSAVYDAVKAGRLPSVRVQGRISIALPDLCRYEFAPVNGRRTGWKLCKGEGVTAK